LGATEESDEEEETGTMEETTIPNFNEVLSAFDNVKRFVMNRSHNEADSATLTDMHRLLYRLDKKTKQSRLEDFLNVE